MENDSRRIGPAWEISKRIEPWSYSPSTINMAIQRDGSPRATMPDIPTQADAQEAPRILIDPRTETVKEPRPRISW